MHADEDKINRITQTIIGCAYRVVNKLGYGFLEKVYENALAHELRNCLLINFGTRVEVRRYANSKKS